MKRELKKLNLENTPILKWYFSNGTEGLNYEKVILNIMSTSFSYAKINASDEGCNYRVFSEAVSKQDIQYLSDVGFTQIRAASARQVVKAEYQIDVVINLNILKEPW